MPRNIKTVEVHIIFGKRCITRRVRAEAGKVFTEEGITHVLNTYAAELEGSESYDFRLVELGPSRFNLVGTPKEVVVS
jgi:hypothetical protein